MSFHFLSRLCGYHSDASIERLPDSLPCDALHRDGSSTNEGFPIRGSAGLVQIGRYPSYLALNPASMIGNVNQDSIGIRGMKLAEGAL
jgi:hypothetical protein